MILAVLLSLVMPAQAPEAFEVASIKANNSGEHGSSANANKDQVMLHNISLKRLVEIAYRVRDYGFSGPDWLDTLNFDITAKMPEGSAPNQYPAMLRTLLIERFKLAVHRESRMVSGYALVPAKSGLKLQAVQTEELPSSNAGHGHLDAKGFSMKDLAELLARTLDRPVADKTGISGKFNLALDFAEDADANSSDSARPSIFTALQEQLGLRLTSGEKVSVEVVVVDHIERVPTDN